MSLPSPNVIKRQVNETIPILEKIPVAYRTASQMAYERIQTEEVKGRATGHGNPTKNLALDRNAQARRTQIEIGKKELDQACLLIRSAFRRFNNSLPDQRSLQSAPEKDSAVGPGYVKEQRDRQRKRMQNQGWDPDSAEVV